MTTGSDQTDYVYDERDQLTQVTHPASPSNLVVKYRYNLDGQRRLLIYPDTTEVTYGFDRAARLTSLVDSALPAGARTTSYTYHPDGRPATVANVNGTTAAYTFDNTRRVREMENDRPLGGGTMGPVNHHTFDELDGRGYRTSAAEVLTQPNGTSQTPTLDFTYDGLGQLTGFTGATTDSYGYDAIGNRTSLTRGATTTTYAYDGADRLLSDTVGGTTTTYGTNGVGNTTGRGTARSYGYDQANRLTSATVSGATSSYTFAGDGTRGKKVSGGVTTEYAYDINRSLPVILTEKVSSPAETRVYVWGLGLAYSRVTTGGTTAVRHVYHGDGLGSVRALTDAAGAITDTYVADPWGVAGVGAGSSAQPFGYTGEQADLETGFLHLRARAYDPSTGRFLQRDPVAGAGRVPTTLNRYAYVLNNPVNYTDPSGMIAPAALAGVAIGAVAGGMGAAAQGGDAGDVVMGMTLGGITGGIAVSAGITGAVATGVMAGASNTLGQLYAGGGDDLDVGSIAGSAVGGYLGAPMAAAAGRLVGATGAGATAQAATETVVGAASEEFFSLAGHAIGEMCFSECGE
jgi:RHS repeat-associated protein